MAVRARQPHKSSRREWRPAVLYLGLPLLNWRAQPSLLNFYLHQTTYWLHPAPPEASPQLRRLAICKMRLLGLVPLAALALLPLLLLVVAGEYGERRGAKAGRPPKCPTTRRRRNRPPSLLRPLPSPAVCPPNKCLPPRCMCASTEPPLTPYTSVPQFIVLVRWLGGAGGRWVGASPASWVLHPDATRRAALTPSLHLPAPMQTNDDAATVVTTPAILALLDKHKNRNSCPLVGAGAEGRVVGPLWAGLLPAPCALVCSKTPLS